MKKIFYSIATAVLVLTTSTLASAKETIPTVIPQVKHSVTDIIVTMPGTCDQFYFFSNEHGRQTVRHGCNAPANAVQLNFTYFNASDNEIIKLFNDETSIKLNDQHAADLIVTNQFYIENFSALASR